MSTREQRIQVFEDTMNWIENNPVLNQAVQDAMNKEKVYYEDEYPSFALQKKDTLIEVTGERSFEAAMRLKKEYPQKTTAVLNFANAFHAGGGVVNGSGAQEECLCRTSTLYPLIHNQNMYNSFYRYHRRRNTPRASDSLIYTKDVLIIKTDEDLPQRLPADRWTPVDVITMAAPDLRSDHMNDAALSGYHIKRALHMFDVLASEGVDMLVLGAFGCGAFRNNPEAVARAYKTALDIFPKVFTEIVFAVYCPPGDSRNFEAFEKEFEC